jgi:hypothetical protein
LRVRYSQIELLRVPMKRHGAAAGVLFVISAVSVLGQSGNPGKVNFSRLANPSLDPYTNSPTTAQQQWLQTNFARMGVFSPYFDDKTAWYAGAQVYQDMYAIYTGSTVASQHPEWILHDASGKRLYIPWGCSNGTCPQYAADIANPGFRAWWIAQMQQIQSQGNYRGLWVDDVNTDFQISDGYGNLVTPVDNSTGQSMTWTAWRYYVAQFLQQVRQAFPNREILHNSVWYAGPNGVRDADPGIQGQLAAANIFNIERGLGSDAGLTGGTGQWSVYALFSYIDRVHQAGHAVVLENYDVTDVPTELYSLAGYYMISNGYDYYGDTSTTPANWWHGFNVNLGAPLGQRIYSTGLYRRNFSQGIVLLGEPGLAPQTVTLPATFTTIDGASVTSVTISGSQGIILLGAYPNASVPSLSVDTVALPAATAGAFYSAGLISSGGMGPYSFSISGAPAGVAVNGTAIAGTLGTTAAGTYSVVATARDNTTGATAQRTLQLTVYTPLSIATSALPAASQNVSYLAALSAAGGSGNYLWTVANAPAGVVISGNSLSGIPSAIGTSSNVIVTVMDMSTALSVQKTFTIPVSTALVITTSTLPSGMVGSAYSAAFNATGGSGNYSWSATGLPAGTTVAGTAIGGTPSAAGTYASVAVTVTDKTTGSSSQKMFSIAVYGAPVIGTSTLPWGTTGSAYSTTLAASGGSGSYSWSATGLPAGLTVAGSALAGTPTTAGLSSNIVVTATDTATGLASQKTLSMTVYSAPAIMTSALASGSVGVSYAASLAAGGGSGSYSWTAASLPAGVGVSGSSLAGTPTAAGSYSNVAITVKDVATGLTAQKTLAVTIYGAAAITTSTLPLGSVGTAYSAALAASGGSGNYSWSASGLPAGITLTGLALAGTPTAAGSYAGVAITLTDTTTGLAAQKTFSITIYNAPAIATSTLASGSIGSAYTAALAATGGSGAYSWSATGLPTGLSLNAATVNGTPTTSGVYSNVAVKVTDTTTGLSAQKTFTITVYGAPAIATSTLPAGSVGSAWTATLASSGGSGSYSWTATGLPAGVTLNNGTLSGTPTGAGTSNVAVAVTDTATGLTAQKTFAVTIYSAPAITTSTLPAGIPGSAYSAALAASGGSGSYSWTATGLPAGITLNGATLAGTPTSAGSYSSVTIKVTDTVTGLTAQKAFALVIYSAPAITTTSLQWGSLGSGYSAALGATGGSASYVWSATGLPPGITVSGNALTGTSSVAGTYAAVAITARDTTTGLTTQKTFSITIYSGPSISLSSLSLGTVGTAYSVNLTAAGGSGTYAWAATGLPAGLAVSGSTITGTPTAAATSTVVITATDGVTGLKAQSTFTLTCAVNQSGTWVALGSDAMAGRPAIVKGSDGTLQTAVLNAGNSLGDYAQNAAYAWQAENTLGGYVTSNPAIGVNNNAGAEIFVRGGDNAIWTVGQVSTGGNFGNWRTLGGQLASDPFVLRSANGALQLFALASDQTVWESAQSGPGGTWNVQPGLGGSIAGMPVAITNSDGTVEVFARGTDNALWHNRQTSAGGVWGGWQSFAGQMSGDPALGIDPDGRVEVFVMGTDHSIWHLAQVSDSSRTWTGWNPLGGYATSAPATALDADGRIEVYIGGGDNALWYTTQTSAGSTSWTGWTSLGGNAAGTVSAVVNGAGTVTVVARGTDNLPRVRTQVAPGIW